jgi:hypothetical protein
MAYFYLSFAERDKFLGAVIVQADGPVEAIVEANRRGLNPGGQVMVIQGVPACAEAHANRLLLTKEEIGRVFGDPGPAVRLGDLPPEQLDAIDAKTKMIDEDEVDKRGLN